MEQKILRYSIGCDISKDSFSVCFMEVGQDMLCKVKGSRQFKNEAKGFKELESWVKKHAKSPVIISFIMEATGVYYENLAWYLYQNDYQVHVLLPYKTKHYLKSLGIKSKNDKIDAQGLSRMGSEQRLKPWKPYSKSIYTLRSLTRQHEGISKLKTMLSNQLHAFEHSALSNETIKKQLKASIKMFTNQLKELESEISNQINKDNKLNQKFTDINLIKGISLLSWATIIAETNGFESFENQRQLVSYSGYDVIENQSGNHVGKTRISKKGNSRIRRILYMPSLVSVKWREPILYNLYQRVYQKTGIKMKGYVAVQKKLLILIYHIWKNNTPFQRNDQVIFGKEESKLLFPLGFAETINESSPH